LNKVEVAFGITSFIAMDGALRSDPSERLSETVREFGSVIRQQKSQLVRCRV
jgi:hypothetical protein